MKQTIGQSQFIDAFRSMGRYDQFGYDALVSLFDYLEQLESDCGEEIELDVISLCCEYSVDTPENIAANYGIDLSDCDDDDDDAKREAVVEYLENETQVIDSDCNGQIIYMQF